MAIRVLLSLVLINALFILQAESQSVQTKATFELGLRLGLNPGMKITQLGGSQSAKFSSKSLPAGGIDVCFIKKLNPHFGIGASFGAGMFPQHAKLDYSNTDYIKLHPRNQKKESYSEDKMFVELGLALSYQLALSKLNALRLDLIPKIHSTSFPSGSTGFSFTNSDSTTQVGYIIHYSNYKQKQFRAGGVISLTYLKMKKVGFYLGVYASLIPSGFQGDYELFPGTSDYAYGNAQARLSTFGIRGGIGFNRIRERK